jgi:type IV secretion system protein VirD4
MLTLPADSERQRTLLQAGLALSGIAAALHIAGILFLTKLNSPELPPAKATPLTVVQYWRHYDDPYTRQWLGWCLFGGALPVFGVGYRLHKQVKRKMYGDARFATRAEVARAGLMGDHGIILGRWGRWDRFLMLPGQQGVALPAAPRSGKGAGLVQTNALSWMGSLLVNDVRKECYRISAGWRSTMSNVYLFDPLSCDRRTAQCNPLSEFYIRSRDPDLCINDVMKLSNRLSPNGAAGDEFWPASCRDLFAGLALYVIETPSVPRTIGEMVRTVMATTAESVGEHLSKLIAARDAAGNPLSDACKRLLYDFIHLAPQTQASIRKTFTSKLQLWQNPLVDAATSADSFNLCDLRRGGKDGRPITIYFGIQPDDLDTMSVLTNLFFQLAYGSNMDKMPEDDPSLIYKVLSIEDEFTAKGKVAGYAQKAGLMGGYNILPMLIYQSDSQLDAVYGVHDAQTIRECIGASVVYAPPPNAFKYAENISRLLGTYTATQVSRSRQAWSVKHGNVNESQTGRALMNPQEVMQMGDDNEIVLVRNLPPILCQKAWYFRQDVFKRRANLPVPPVPPILPTPRPDVAAPAAPAAPPPAATAASEADEKTKPSTRPVEPADLKKLDKMSLSDFAYDETQADLLKGDLNPDEFKSAFADFLNAQQASLL